MIIIYKYNGIILILSIKLLIINKMKYNKTMFKNDKIRIYINTSKAYYYPGQKLEASIFIDVSEKTRCDKLQVIAKGKMFINAIQTGPYSDDEDEIIKTAQPDVKGKKKKKLKEFHDDDTSSEEAYVQANQLEKKFKETNEIFKYKKIIKISSEEYLNPGKYSFPLEIELPEKIPGTFLYIKKKAYIEIAYSLKVKLNKVMLKEVIPIVIRQRESTFNYKNTNEFEKSILACCFDNNTAKITVSTPNKYILSNEEVQLNIIIDNKKNDILGSPLYIELYQRIILFPKDKMKKIKITNLVGQYGGKKVVRPRKIYHKEEHFYIDKLELSLKELSEIKAMKHYKHKDVISFLNSSVNSDLLICEYEAYCAVQYPNWDDEELGVFISVLVYPPTDGIRSKTVDGIAKDFNNSLINKKIILNKEQNIEDSKKKKYEDEFQKKMFHKYNDGSEERYMKKMLELEQAKELIKIAKKAKTYIKEDINEIKEINEKNEDMDDNNVKNKENNIKNNSENNNDNNNDNKINIINIDNKKFDKDSIDAKVNLKNQIKDTDTINSLQIKKEFTGDFLKDDLDNEFLDKESFQ